MLGLLLPAWAYTGLDSAEYLCVWGSAGSLLRCAQAVRAYACTTVTDAPPAARARSEETINASRRQPRAILIGCLSMFVFGLALIISLLFSLPVRWCTCAVCFSSVVCL